MYYCKPRGSHVVVTDQDFKAVSFFSQYRFSRREEILQRSARVLPVFTPRSRRFV